MSLSRFMLSKSCLCLFVGLVAMGAPSASWSQTATATDIVQLLGSDASPPPYTPDQAQQNKLLDFITYKETRRIAAEDEEFSQQSDKATKLAAAVRASYKDEIPRIIAAEVAAMGGRIKRFQENIAADVPQEDIDFIMAFYQAPEGMRYRDFLNKINKIMDTSLPAVGASQQQKTITNKPDPEQENRLMRMMTLSHLFQSTYGIEDTVNTGSTNRNYGGIGSVAGLDQQKNQAELIKLDQEYQADLPYFEAFAKSDANRRLYRGVAVATMKLFYEPSGSEEIVNEIAQRNEVSWKAIYQAP